MFTVAAMRPASQAGPEGIGRGEPQRLGIGQFCLILVSGIESEMLTDEEIRRLIALKSEGPNLDYKAGFAWTKDTRDKKYGLVRDLMAFSNTKDGGRVIFGVRDEDFSFVGVPSEVYESADPSSVVQMLHDNGAPKVRCAVFKREIDGKRVVVFDA